MNDFFSLLDRPWIPVRFADGTRREIGLLEVFREAHRIVDVVDDVPTSTMAVHRILVAIAYRALNISDETAWALLFDGGRFPDEVLKYLENVRGRFDLFGKKPFFQHVFDDPDRDAQSILKLWHFGEESSSFFGTAPWSSPEPVPAGTAARMMIASQYFGRCGTHSCLHGENNKAVAGPLADVTSVLVLGPNLFETVLLNTPGRNFVHDIYGKTNDLPWWERPHGSAQPGAKTSGGYLDQLTRPTRRIMLVPEEDGRVKRVILMKGLDFPVEGRVLTETMTPWKRFDGKAFPIRWNPDELAWQNSHVLFRAFDDPDGNVEYRPSKTVLWVSRLADLGAVAPSKRLRLAVFGTCGDKGKVDFWRQEFLPLRSAYLSSPELSGHVKEAVAYARKVRDLMSWAVRKGCSDVFDYGLKKLPGTSASKSMKALHGMLREFMASLDGAFKRFLAHLPLGGHGALDSWKRRVELRARQYVDTGLDAVASGIRGAMIKGTVGKRLGGALRSLRKGTLDGERARA